MFLAGARTASYTLLTGFVASLVVVQAQTTFRYQFKRGDTLAYYVQTDSESKLHVKGRDLGSVLKLNLEVAWRVLEVDTEGKARIAQKIGRVRMTMQEPGQDGKSEYDSRDGKVPEGKLAGAMGSSFNAITGTEITVTMDTRGNVGDVELPAKLIEALKKVAQSSKEKSVEEMFAPDNLKRLYNPGDFVLPSEAVSQGSTWDKKIDKKMPLGTMKGTNTMTYDGTTTEGGRSLAKISMKPVVTMESDPKGAIAMKIKGNDSQGTALFDSIAGRLVEMRTNEAMQIEVSVGGLDLPGNNRTTTVWRLKSNAP